MLVSVSDGFQALGQFNLRQGGAAFESLLFNRLQPLREHDFFDRVNLIVVDLDRRIPGDHGDGNPVHLVRDFQRG